MNEQIELTPPNVPIEHKADSKQMRAEQVGALLGEAYKGASLLKLKLSEAKELTAPFPDESIEIRPHDAIIYISHMALRERLWKVFGPTEVAEICRERAIRSESNEVMVDLVLMIRGKFVAEAIATAKWYPNNPKANMGDVVESAWSDALRRCCKKIGVGTQVWHPQYIRDWTANHAIQSRDRWYRKDDPRSVGMIKETPFRKTALKENNEDKIPL